MAEHRPPGPNANSDNGGERKGELVRAPATDGMITAAPSRENAHQQQQQPATGYHGWDAPPSNSTAGGGRYPDIWTAPRNGFAFVFTAGTESPPADKRAHRPRASDAADIRLLRRRGSHPPPPVQLARHASDPSTTSTDSDFYPAVAKKINPTSVQAEYEMDLREAIRTGRISNFHAALKRSGVLQELMARNAEGGAGLLMLAAATGRVQMLNEVAMAIKNTLGTKLLARQMRFEDDQDKPLLFYAASSKRSSMLVAVRHLLQDTIGLVGLGDQVRHLDANEGNVLMQACNDPGAFEVVWELLESNGWLEEQLSATDRDGRGWLLHAAEAGNSAVLSKLRVKDHIQEATFEWDQQQRQGLYDRFADTNSWLHFAVTDKQGWNGFMYAARPPAANNLEFLGQLFALCENVDNEVLASGLNPPLLLMHAAIGGYPSFVLVCKFVRDKGLLGWSANDDEYAVLLSCAARGGDVLVLNAVAGGLKAGRFPDGQADGPWYEVATDSDEEATRLVGAIEKCAKRGTGVSLFLSAIRSGVTDMIKAVVAGIEAHVPAVKDLWDMLCGVGGSPLVVAASVSVEAFKVTLSLLKEVVELDDSNELEHTLRWMLLPETEKTPLYSAVCSDNTALFDEVLKAVKEHLSENEDETILTSSQMFRQMEYGMRTVGDNDRGVDKWISAMMLPKVIEAMKVVDETNDAVVFDVSLLDDFLEAAVKRGAFDHVRVLVKNGCDLVKHFPALLGKIGVNENDVSECMILAITAASNPFVECGIAAQTMYAASITRNKNHAALGRLQHKIGELALELLEHLPHTVSGIGAQLARGDPELEPFEAIQKIKPAELLGYVVVGWILEGCGERAGVDDGRAEDGGNPLLQAVRSGPQAMELLSEPLVLDYLGLKFSRTLPSWNTQHPFERNINQAFYSYTLVPCTGAVNAKDVPRDFFQRLLLRLQGWPIKGSMFPNTSILPGLQFTLAGVIGKPVAYYVVPAIRMAFVVMSYLAMISLYLSCVSLKSEEIPPNEWLFYIYMAAVAWRETLEFLHARTSEPGSEPGVGASIERYFYDKWNFLDVTTIVFVTVAFIFRMMEWHSGELRHLFMAQVFLAVSAPLLFSRVLFLSQVGSALGPMTQVIFNMLNQLAQFSVVLLLVMLGFASCFSALYGSDSFLVERNFPTCDVNDHPVVDDFGSVGDALLTMFTSMLGEFSFEAFYDSYEDEEGNDCGGVLYREAGIALLVVYLIIMAVMLLNLLIAVLSTAHAEVDRNAEKEFHLARAKIILQSGEDVLNDVLPPPFNLIKPALGMIWPSCGRRYCDRIWSITTGALHRLIFALFVGLGALTLSSVLWVVSLPLVAWRMAGWLSTKNLDNCKIRTSLRPGGARPLLRRSITRPSHQPRWPTTQPSVGGSSSVAQENGTPSRYHAPVLSRHDTSVSSLGDPEVKLKKSIERIFYRESGAAKGRFSMRKLGSLTVCVSRFLLGAMLGLLLCCVVYPVLSIVLWVRGLFGVFHYVQDARSKTSPWERRQADLGEEGEWAIARGHAIKRNVRYWTANSSEDEFNVDALLKTTTGMTMEDLRHNMTNLKSIRRQRALGASMDVLLKQHPSDDHR